MTETPLWGRQWRLLAVLAVLVVGFWGAVQALDPEETLEREALIERLAGGRGFLDPVSLPSADSLIGQCIEWGDAFYMLPISMTEPQARSFVEGLPPHRTHRYQPHNTFWVRTATNGNVSVPGRRITLTWSFVPDGTMIIKNYETGNAPSHLYEVMNETFASEQAWKDLFRRAFDEFGELVGVNYVEVEDDGATQPAIGVLGTRGDVRISMIPMPVPGPLAFNYFPIPSNQINSSFAGVGGDMVFNSSYMFLMSNPAGQHRYLRNVIMHEHGHGLGFRHVDPINQTKLMEAIATSAFDGPQEDDIRGFQSAYGDRLEDNNTPATATLLPPLPTTPDEPLFFDNLAVEFAQARDHYRINVPELTVLGVRAEPFGTLYPQGPQNGAVSNVHGQEVLDLVLDVLDGTGEILLHTVDENGLGSGEQFEIPLLQGSGEYLFRVRSKGTLNQSQRYRMWVGRSEGVLKPTYVALNPIVDDSAGNATGTPDPGERGVRVTIPLRNIGFSFGGPFTAELVSDSPTVTVVSSLAEYGPAGPTETTEGDVPFRFDVSDEHECGDPIVFQLRLSLDEEVQVTTLELDTGLLGPGALRRYAGSIPDPASLSYLAISTIMIDEDFPVGLIRLKDINVTVSGMEGHRFVLRSPSGKEVVLSDGAFSGSNLRGTNLEDGALSITAALAPYTGTYRAMNQLSSVAGDSSLGPWQLRVIHKQGGRAAIIDSWELELAPYYLEPFCSDPLLIPVDGLFESFSIY